MALLPYYSATRFRILMFSLIWGCAGYADAHGDYHEVVSEIEKALKNEPKNADLHFRLAVICEEHGEWSSALVALECAERLAPGQYPVALVQGMALAKGGQWRAAESMLNEFLATHPKHAKALTERARVRIQLQRPDEAICDFQEVIENCSQPEAEVFFEMADVWLSKGNITESARVLNEAVTKLQSHPELLERAFEMTVNAGQYEVALRHLEGLYQVSPKPHEWLARKAQLLGQWGRPKEAQKIWLELRDHILARPNLERGQPYFATLLEKAQRALGETPATTVVVAPPAPVKVTPLVR
ncbi:tetratricopeptide repeat protein [Prosthecobacter dejongeii]|uniref:Tetratricopeptide (TPR) repeat protein n=1 Tax=Prosthecobacter dejongeii TaxID=48465 RepID=A0A7W7YQW6_9BACT|nr:tetratricopeptide repeat protein [Prosthecobacter dejongeii]MBB5040512.1 tetratricopeptide (TPR) repeat protein [Prosthecobacter dejongeii]